MKYYLIGTLAVILIVVFIIQTVVGIIYILPSVLMGFVIIGMIMFIYYLIKAIKENI